MRIQFRAALTIATAALLAGGPARAQSGPEPLGGRPWSHMHTLLRKTVFKVDVLTVDLCFDAPTAGRFAALAAKGPPRGAAADGIVRAALDGQRSFARVEFLRNISLDQFLEGVREDLGKARTAGLLADSVYRVIVNGLPGWYAFARERGIRKGDQILYNMDGETVRTRFRTREGATPLDDTQRGRARRNSPLASWLTPGSEFRAGLLASLPSGGGAAGAGRCQLAGR